MIKSINIQNFQSHKDTTLDFHKGMNVIVGKTDSGKTAIIRALRWLVTNRPSGDAFCSFWGGDTKIKLETETEEIIRIKSSKENQYELNSQIFKAMGKDVPDEILKALNMDDVNIQQQMDSHFLISETPGAVALHFNKVARLDKIDKGLQNVQKEITKTKQTIDYETLEIEKKEVKLNEFQDLEEMEEEIIAVEVMETRHWKLTKKKIELSKNKQSLISIQNKIQETKEICKAEEEVKELLFFYEGQRVTEAAKTKFQKTINEIKGISKDIENIKSQTEIEEPIKELLKMYDKQTDIHRKSIQLRKMVDSIGLVKKKLKSTLNDLKEFEQEFKDNFPEVCPLCEK